MDSVNYYDDNAAAFYDSTFAVEMGALYREFLLLVPNGSGILDAGCGSGRDALAFKQAGFDVVAFDASKKLCERARQLLGQDVHHARFDTFTTSKQFSGIWCCASLLHVSRDDLPQTMQKLVDLLVPSGVMYLSFKYGQGEVTRDGRTFTNMDEENLEELLGHIPAVSLLKAWQTGDKRPDRANERWLNAIIRKG